MGALCLYTLRPKGTHLKKRTEQKLFTSICKTLVTKIHPEVSKEDIVSVNCLLCKEVQYRDPFAARSKHGKAHTFRTDHKHVKERTDTLKLTTAL